MSRGRIKAGEVVRAGSSTAGEKDGDSNGLWLNIQPMRLTRAPTPIALVRQKPQTLQQHMFPIRIELYTTDILLLSFYMG